jgi:hypothetical protein
MTRPALPRPNLRDQPLEAISVAAGRTRLAQVIVDDVNAFARPAKENCPLDQAILLLCALLVMTHLAR